MAQIKINETIIIIKFNHQSLKNRRGVFDC